MEVQARNGILIQQVDSIIDNNNDNNSIIKNTNNMTIITVTADTTTTIIIIFNIVKTCVMSYFRKTNILVSH
jgi:hypothetical protein